MDGRAPSSGAPGTDGVGGAPRRRSPRLSLPPPANVLTDRNMATGPGAVKRSITVRKIAPRKTIAKTPELNKENRPRRSGSGVGAGAGTGPGASQQKKQKVSTPGPVSGRGGSQKKAAMPSPILPPSPPPSRPQQPALDPEDAVWSQKVRRSYSRLSDRSLSDRSLSDKSLSSPDPRETLFGFEKLQTPEVVHRVRRAQARPEALGSLSCTSSFTSLLEAEDGGPGLSEPDPNIPGVVVVKEKKRRRKVQQIETSELDALAAEMNAVFEEAEEFELFVE